MDLVVATRNPGKFREIVTFLQDFDLTLRHLDDFPEIGEIAETGKTFKENALLKARTVATVSGCLALADDSGLEVAALEGRPGIYSARFAGPGATDQENNEKLLAELEGISVAERSARYCCVIAVVIPSGEELVVAGSCEGAIGLVPQGAGGFGYDPLFISSKLGKTFAEATPTEKGALSHRGKALHHLQAELTEFLEKFSDPPKKSESFLKK